MGRIRCGSKARLACGLDALADDDLRVQGNSVVKVDDVDVAHPDAARGHRMADLLRLVRAVDAIERVLVALVKVERARAERVVRAALRVLDMRPAGLHL